MKITKRIHEPHRCYTEWDDNGLVGAGVKTRTWEQRVQHLESLGADRSDAQAVIDAEDVVNKGTQFETFAWSMQWNRVEKLNALQKKMFENIKKKKEVVV